MPMEESVKSAGDMVWPDVSTKKGADRASLIGAMALAWISGVYGISLLHVLSGGDLIDGPETDATVRSLAAVSLAAGSLATAYLSLRIWGPRCPIAAWVGLLWIGYETLNALLGIIPENPLVFLLLTFAAFQGVRACNFVTDTGVES